MNANIINKYKCDGIYETYNLSDDKYLIYDIMMSDYEVEFKVTRMGRHLFLNMSPDVFNNICEVCIGDTNIDIIYDFIILNISKYNKQKYLHGIVISNKYLESCDAIRIKFNDVLNNGNIKIYQFDKLFSSQYKLSFIDHISDPYFKYSVYRNHDDDMVIYEIVDTKSSNQHNLYINEDRIIRYEYECQCEDNINNIISDNDNSMDNISNKLYYLKQYIRYTLMNMNVDDIDELIPHIADFQNKIKVLQNTSDYLFEKIKIDID